MSAADSRAILFALNSPYQGRQFVVSGPETTIGRSAECEIQIDLISVSRKHAVIQAAGGGFRIRDLGSRNGLKINDIDLPEADLRHGDIVTVGEVQLRFEESEPARETSEPASPAAEEERRLTGMDVIAAAQSATAPAEAQYVGRAETEPETGPTRQFNFKLLFAVILGLALAVAAVVAAYQYVLRPRDADGLTVNHVLLEVGEKRWGEYAAKYGDFIEENVRIEDDTVADLRRSGPRQFIVLGKSGGATTASIVTRRGYTVQVRIIVRGRKKDELEELAEQRIPAEERRRRAEMFVKSGLLILEEKPYLAMKEFAKAVAVLEPLRSKGLIFARAKKLYDRAKNRVDEEWDDLAGQIDINLKQGQYSAAVDLLDRAVELIPDENDPRHQKALRRRFAIIQKVRADERKRRRGR